MSSSRFNGVPVLRMELEGMKFSIMAMLDDRIASMDLDVRASVEAFCTPERIKGIIDQQVRECITLAIEDEVKSFYNYSGAGRAIVKAAVLKRLSE